MVGGNGENQFRQYAGQNAENPAGYNDGIGNQVIQNAVQNPRVQNVGNPNGLIGVQGNGNQNQIENGNLMAARAEGNIAGQNGNQIRCYNCRGVGHYARNCTVRPRRRDAAYLQTQLLIAQKEEAGIQLQAEEYDLMAAAADLDEIEEVNANCILMANLQQASTSEEQYTELLKPIPESHQVPQNDNNVISADTSIEQGVDNTKTKRPQPRSNTKNDRVPFASESSRSTNKEAKVEEHHRNLLLSKNNEHISSACNNIKIDSPDVISKVVCAMCKKCLIFVNHDKCLRNFMNDKNSRGKKQKAKVSFKENQMKYQPKATKPKKVGFLERLATPKPRNLEFSLGVDNTKTRRPQPRSNAKHDRVPSASKSSRSKNQEAEVEEHHRNLLLSKNNKHISSVCYNIKIDSQDVISKVVCAMCKECLISVNHDKCLCNYVNGKNSRGKKQKAKVSFKENQMKYQPTVTKPKKVESYESLATSKPRKSRLLLRWSPTGRLFNQEGKIVDSSASVTQSDCVNGDNACTSNSLEPKIKWFPNSTSLLDRVYFVDGLGHNFFSVGQFCDSDLKVQFRRNACFVRNLEGVDLLKGDRSTNLYTINLHEMASASLICLMARASSTKSWLWHQRLSHLNFDTINDLARNDLVAEITSSSYEFLWTNENCQHKWKAVCFGDYGRLLLLHMGTFSQIER
nr:retrovirus-related Pol polyprotein from transposon TNT 1-94 [Tanacetum cinerariifolium]